MMITMQSTASFEDYRKIGDVIRKQQASFPFIQHPTQPAPDGAKAPRVTQTVSPPPAYFRSKGNQQMAINQPKRQAPEPESGHTVAA